MTRAPRTLAWRLIAVFVVGFVGLTLEIAYTRVISFKLFYYYTYFVIGLALLGMGTGSAVVSLSRRLRATDPLKVVAVGAPITAVVGLIAFAVVARLGTTTDLIWAGNAGEAVSQLARLIALSISLTAVFFVLGVILAALIVAEAHEVRRLYFWDLLGAGLACLAAVPLQAVLSPPAIILTCLVVMALLGVVLDTVTRERSRSRTVAFAAVAVVVGIGAFAASSLDIRPDSVKTIKDDDVAVAGGWGPVFRVDVLDLDDAAGTQLLIHDGLWGSSIWRYDGTPATTARFETDSRRLAFDALGSAPERILIIGAAGGNEIQAALTYGVGHIDAVELNPITVDLLRNEFAEYSGGIAADPRVNYVRGDGRTFLARSDEVYDLIWFVAPDSYAAANAASSGAFVLSESYLYTEEMISEAFGHLSERGLIVAQFGDFDFVNKPNRTARYLVTARTSLEDRIQSFADHTALIVDRTEFDVARLSTIIIGREPLSGDTVERLATSLEGLEVSRPIHLPGLVIDESVTADIIVADRQGLDEIIATYPYSITSVSDDQPFFWHFTAFSEVITDWSRGIEDTEIAIGERLLVVLLLIALVVAGAMLWLPFAITRAAAIRLPVNGMRSRLFCYFAALGLGFMLVEISMIQRFALLLGYPTLSLSVSLFTLLVSTGVGARWSAWVRERPMQRIAAVAGALVVLVALYIASSDAITDLALGWPSWVRIAIVIALLFPVGVLLGMFLPYGIDLAVGTAAGGPGEGRLVAWCWAVNGFFSVMGALLTTMLSMTFGFNRTVVLGLLLYLLAAVLARSSTRRVEAAAVGVS